MEQRNNHCITVSLSTINYQLSTINYQLSTINYQLSTINYQLSTSEHQVCPQLPHPSTPSLMLNDSLTFLNLIDSHQPTLGKMDYSTPFVLPFPLSQPPTLPAYSSRSSNRLPSADALYSPPTPPLSTFERMQQLQSLASYDVSLGLRYVPPTAPLPPPASPALSALSLSLSASADPSHSSLSSYSALGAFGTSPAQQPTTHYSLFSHYPGVAVLSHSRSTDEREAARERERSVRAAAERAEAEKRRRAEEDRRKRQEASRQRRAEQLRKAREEREKRAAEERKEQDSERPYATLAEVMPPKQQPSLPKQAVREGGGRTVARGWVDVSEAELAQQRRAEDARLREESRLKLMQEKIALLKARMELKDHHSRAPSPSAAPSSASHPRVPLTFSASPYAPMSAVRRSPSSPARARPSPQRLVSPRRPHPFLRHSPIRRRRLSLSPKKQRRRSDEQQQQQQQRLQRQRQLGDSNGNMRAGQSVGDHQHQAQQSRFPVSPNRPKQAPSPTRPSHPPTGLSDSHENSRRGSDVVSSTSLSAHLQSLVEAEIGRRMADLSLTNTPSRRPAPPSPPLVPAQSAEAPSPLLHRYASLSVIGQLDELVADVLDRVVEDTVTELNAAEERQRASAVLDEVDAMVSELERMEDSVTKRWLCDTPAHQTQPREALEQRIARDDIATSSPTPYGLPRAMEVDMNRSVASATGFSSAPTAGSLLSKELLPNPSSTSAPRVSFQPRVLPVCVDVSPQLADPTGVAMAERWCDELVEEAVSTVANEMWHCLDSVVDAMVEQVS